MKTLVVTPTLGDSPWLAATVASVAALPLTLEHVLVAPAARVEELAGRFPRTTVRAEPGGGMYAAINHGLESVSGWDAFTYLNDDDLLLPGFARVVSALASRGAAPCLAYGRVGLVDREGAKLGEIPVSPFPGLNRALYAQRLEPVYQHGTLVNRAAWQEHGGFDAGFRFCGDSEYLARLCGRGVPALHVGALVAAFRLRPGQLTKQREAMVADRARVDEKLGLTAGVTAGRRRWARLVFRAANLPVYAGRILRHGPVTFDQLIERGG